MCYNMVLFYKKRQNSKFEFRKCQLMNLLKLKVKYTLNKVYITLHYIKRANFFR